MQALELGTRGRYAVMALVELAAATTNAPSQTLRAIAATQHISMSYLEQLFLKLRRAGLVESVRGRSGGYRLLRSANKISVRDVMVAVAEPTDMTRCASGLGEPCMGGKRCRTHDLWDALGQHIDQFLGQVTLQDILDGTVRAPVASGAVENNNVNFASRRPTVTAGDVVENVFIAESGGQR